VQTSLSLGAVLALALGAAWVVRALAKRNSALGSALGAGGRAPAGILEILGRYPVGRGATLVLLKLDRRILLLSQNAGGRMGSGAGFTTLSEITDPEEVASILVKARDADGDSMAERFRSMLGRADRDLADAEAAPRGRRARSTSAGDTAEVWDTAAGTIPVVDLTRQPGPAEHAGAATLRRRLASLQTQSAETTA
jgi:flagellar biogenesis protein FliO